MTPEEKLLALIQQDKRQAEGGAKAATTAPAPSVAPIAAPSGPPEPVTPPPKPKPAPEVAPSPVQPVQSAPVSAKSVPVETAAVPPEKKLKLVEPKADPVPKGAATMEVKETKGEIRSPKSEVSEPQGESREAKGDRPTEAGPVAAARVSTSPVDPNTLAGPAFRPGGGSGVLLLNRILGVVVLVLVGVVFYSVASIRPGIAKALERQISGAGSLSVTPAVITNEGAISVEACLDKVSGRNIFVVKAKEQGGGAAAKAESAGAPKELKLVAVSMDSASPADSMAIIRSKSDSKTYFVKTGQTVGDTDYVLDRVLVDRVVLKLRKQEFELK